ncbi:MAG TPA: GyrI-like domain-containing protein [Candidatus Omnitrophota bacterium]|nr:GyrI-like domain-containing protein [Candidatus Omnitrophota bacterium]
MKILKWALIVIVVIVIALAVFLWYMGAFSAPKVTERKIGPFLLAYEEYTGPYSGIEAVMKRVDLALTAQGIKASRGFGIYLNDPNTTSPDQLRSELGYVIEEKDQALANKLGKEIKLTKWAAKNCLVAEFPLRNNLSYMIGPMKAYPELSKAFKAKNYKMGGCMELYDMPAGKIFFIFEIAK